MVYTIGSRLFDEGDALEENEGDALEENEGDALEENEGDALGFKRMVKQRKLMEEGRRNYLARAACGGADHAGWGGGEQQETALLRWETMRGSRDCGEREREMRMVKQRKLMEEGRRNYLGRAACGGPEQAVSSGVHHRFSPL